MKKLFKEKCFYIVLALFLVTCGLIWFSNRQYESSKKLIEEVEYYDSLNNYNKIYYSKTFKEIKKENKELYDSLKQYKDKIDFMHQMYGKGKINISPITDKDIATNKININK